MNIAFIGLRGVPAKWGGIETFVEATSARLAQKGHHIVVYSRKDMSSQFDGYNKLDVIYTPTIKIKKVSSIVHAFISSLHAAFQRYDVVHLHAYMSYFSIPLLKLFRKKVIITLHGAAWKNISYSKLERSIIKFASLIGIKLSNAVTTVSLPLKKELEELHKMNILLTPVGTNSMNYFSRDYALAQFNLRPNKYILFLGRLEKVKRIHWIIKAFRHINPCINLVIAGDAEDRGYKDYLYELSKGDKRITFTGFVEGKLKEEFLSSCLFFVLPSFIEGMPVSLLEAMSHRKVCLVSDIPAHKWIIKNYETGFLFKHDSFEDFLGKMRNLINMPHEAISKIGTEAQRFVETNFDWDVTANLLEDLYSQVVRG